MVPRPRFGFVLIWVALTAGSVAQTPGAGQATQEQPRPTFRTEANYVRVDLYASRDGRPVEDLRQDEIAIFEDGVKQDITAFEHVHVRPAGPENTRIEPNTVRESRQMAADPRARVFVIFLDTYHTQSEGSHNMRVPLARFLDRVLGQDDMVALMTPEMSAENLTFARKTGLISAMMQNNWNWGRRDSTLLDPQEQNYESCYPRTPSADGIAEEMIGRRREKLSLDALEDLIIHLGGLREERKAVITVSEGWLLYERNPNLARVTGSGVPGRPPAIVGTRPPAGDPDPSSRTAMYDCDADRSNLAGLDDRRRVQDLAEQANRANVSFYPVYPRGLAVFDAPAGFRQPPSPADDARNLRTRQDNLRVLAENTDGIALVNTSDIDAGLRRIADDLTSYYLLGYYSTNQKLDGKFRAITARIARPGVEVRTRRGYRGPTAEALTRSTAAPGSAPGPLSPFASALAGVSSVSARSLVRVRAAVWPGTNASARTAAAVWLVAELDPALRKQAAWAAGGKAELVIVSAAGDTLATRTLDVDAGPGAFSERLPETGGLPPGEYTVRVQVRPKDPGAGALPVSEVARVIVPGEASNLGEALMWRRGPTTGPRYVMTADPRLQRSERLKLEHATTREGVATGRMLDRTAKPMLVPVTLSERQDASGEFRWIVAEAALAPLAPGDYAIEVTLDEAKVVTAFQVVP